MSEYRIASRYAKSLLSLANEQGAMEAVHNDMQMFSNLIKENRDLELMLKSPIILSSKKLEILYLIFEGKVNDLTLRIFDILTKKRREAFLPAIAREIHHQYNVNKGIAEATVTTTIALDDELRNDFKSVVTKISGKGVELTEKVDEGLIGGFVLKIGDRQIDDSISARLRALRLKFIQNSYVKEF